MPISAFFHSNVAHFLLNLLGIQVYGYFVEWYYSKAKLTLTLAFAIVFAHFLAAAAQPLSVSTTSSSVLFAILGLKVYFLY